MVEERGGRVFRIVGLPKAGWLAMHGLELMSCRRVGREPKIAFYDPEDRGPELVLKWPSSQAARWYAAIRGLRAIWNNECPQRGRDGPLYSTRQVSHAGWLAMHEFELWLWNRNGPSFAFEFRDPDGLAAAVIAQWPSSEAARFDSALKEVKGLLNAA